MKYDKIREWASKNCPYKKFKWHTEDMCKNCTEAAGEIEALVDTIVQRKVQGVVACALSEVVNAKDETEDMGFFAKLFGRKSAVVNAMNELKLKIASIGE